MDCTSDERSTAQRERALRRRLGIPDDAVRVLVLAESSHWDPNWLRTSEGYFPLVRANLDRAIEELLREPRRVYSLECLFFLRLYWERCPHSRDKVRSLVNEGRLRLTSSGVTTADTLLPHPEALLRDWLLGQEWLRSHGMAQEPGLAYFADSFGASPALPSLLRAAGFDRTALTRVDGMYFVGADYERRARFPRPGSSAELLLKGERSLDFLWRGPDGAQVLCHWNAFSYGQGDLLAHRGLSRTYLFPFARPDRSGRHVACRLAQFAGQLAPVSRTPYLFCPIGFDFVSPIPGLVALLDRYNRHHYPATGVWAVNAGLDDYLALVDCHRHRLPVLELDPNPYWTGFYASRPALKARCHALVELLLLAERLASLSGDPDVGRALAEELAPAWWDAVCTNHHDFITGTSPDRVVAAEQSVWLDRATEAALAAVARLAPTVGAASPPAPAVGPASALASGVGGASALASGVGGASALASGVGRASPLASGVGRASPLASGVGAGSPRPLPHQPDTPDTPSPLPRGETDRPQPSPSEREDVPLANAPALTWHAHAGRILVHTPHYLVELGEDGGGAIVAARCPATDATLLAGPCNDLVSYRDSGGLWRLGHEYRGGTWRETRRASDRPAALEVRELAGGLEVACTVRLDGEPLRRRAWFTACSPVIRFRLEGRAPRGRTVTVRFATGLSPERLATGVPGGVVSRPLQRVYDPTFWPLQSFCHVQDGASGRGLALLAALPGGVSCRPDGRLEVLALRNARRERAWGVLPLLAMPASGYEASAHALEYAVAFTASGDWRENGLPALARSLAASPWGDAGWAAFWALAESAATTSRPDVAVIAVKAAWRGAGLIVRLSTASAGGSSVALRLAGRAVRQAWLCDARERDIEPLEVRDGAVCLTMPGNLATVRLLAGPDAGEPGVMRG